MPCLGSFEIACYNVHGHRSIRVIRIFLE
jgi:hypothetical protein